MDSSADGDGNAVNAVVTKALMLCLFLIPFSVYKSHPKTRNLSTVFVKQKAPPVVFSKKAAKNKGRKKLYLTFDDGPNRGTRNVFRIVQDEGVPVSFFIVGEHVFASPSQTQMWDSLKMAQGIELCNHSFSHAHSHYERFYESPDSVVADFKRTADSLDLTNNIGRTPGRNIWRVDTLRFTDLKKGVAAADSLQIAGFTLMGWDLEWSFNHKTMCVETTAEGMMAQIDSVFKHNRTRRKDNLVLLAHDQAYAKSEDSFQLRQFFQLLKKSDYELSLISDYADEADTTAVQ